MSVTAPPTDIDAFPGQPPKSPWRTVIIAAVILGVLIAVMMLFSGKITIFSKTQQPPPPPRVMMSPTVSPVVRPPEPRPVAAEAPALPRPHAPLPGITSEIQKARESGIQAYAVKSTAAAVGAGTAGKPGAGVADPDAIPASGQPDALEASLTPTKITGTRVSELPNPRWLVEEGRILRCNQITRINSSLPGAVTAIIPDPIRGETGDVEVMPKGAKVFGTVQHALINGLSRLAVLWQDITTPVLYDTSGMPRQFRIAVNSPAASELGETGLDGDVNRHLFNPFPGKLGAVIGMSLIQGGIQAGVNSAQRSNGNTSLNFNSFQSGGESASNQLLSSWTNIPDVLTRDQGLGCSVFVMRDLDMRGAYQLVQKYRTAP